VLVSAEEDGVPAYRYVVQGRVQGVGYRYFVLRRAGELGVTGFARNLPDGSVEVIAEGRPEALVGLESGLREGPAFSEVTSVLCEEISPRGDGGFHIR
jgi:acylphosphatase